MVLCPCLYEILFFQINKRVCKLIPIYQFFSLMFAYSHAMFMGKIMTVDLHQYITYDRTCKCKCIFLQYE